MKPAAFDYLAAKTVEEAVAALADRDAKIIAGGQSLVPMMNFRLVQPELLVDINGIGGLSDIVETERGLRFGALVRHVQSQESELAARYFPIISEAMNHVAHVAIRNRGTVGGSLCHADAAAEWPLLVTLLDGELEIYGAEGRRTVSPPEFFIAPLVTSLEETEILTSVHLPFLPAGTGTAFDEFSQRAGDFAIVSAGAVLVLEEGRITEARLAIGGVGDTPLRAHAAEQYLLGKTPEPEILAAAADLTTEGVEPNTDLHASSEFRLHLMTVLAERVLLKATERAEAAAG